jgi:hypothetical protein
MALADTTVYMRAWGLLLYIAVQACAQPEILEAARTGRTKLVEAAIAGGSPVDARDLSGRTALMLAAENGHALTVRLLLDKGADANARDAHGWSAYMFALLAPSGDAVHAHEAVLKLLPAPPRIRIAVNAMWAPPENGFQSCFLRPEPLTQQIRDLRPDGMVLEAFQRFVIASGRDLVAVVQSDAMGTSEVPNKVAREDVDATLLLTAEPEVNCGYQADKVGMSIRVELVRPGKESRVLSGTAGRAETAANPRQYAPMLLEQVKREVGPMYWSVVAALMEQR